jgi:hypothetical protein
MIVHSVILAPIRRRRNHTDLPHHPRSHQRVTAHLHRPEENPTMLLALTLISILHAAPADSLNGTWQIKGDVVGNPLNETCEIHQSGTALTGSCQIQDRAPFPLEGELKDGKITFKHGGEYEGTALTMVYTGTLAANEMKGTIDVQPFNASGTFTATPAPAAAAPAPAKKP